jgi:hydrogenase-4 component B
MLVAYPFAGALLVYAFGRKNTVLRDYLADFITISEFLILAVLLLIWGGQADAWESVFASGKVAGFCGFGLAFEIDGFRLVYATIAALMWMMTTILSREYFQHHENVSRFYLFLLLTFGATMGVFLSADLYTTFIFFEIMSFTSYVWVAQEENAASLRAAGTYLAVAVIGGLVMLMGIFLLYHTVGTLTMRELLPAVKACENKGVIFAAGLCMLTGFGAKAGAFPLHIWLPKAHPVAPAPASALLSGILTKTGIFGILVITSELFLYDARWGKLILLLGVLTMTGGAVLAVFSIDLKRTLACSSMSQIGFIMVGIGMQCLLGEENAMAVHGTMLHMMNHSMIKLVLFMAAGVVYMNTHVLDLNEIRGFGRKKPLLKVIFLVGALAIGGIPLFGGYISKTLIHESIVEYSSAWIFKLVEYLFLGSGGLTVAYMTKLFVAIFVEENESKEVQRKFDKTKHYMNAESTFALAGSALILLIWGLFPHGIMDRAAELGQGLMHLEEAGESVAYFSAKNLSGALISIIVGAIVYVVIIRQLLMEKTRSGKKRYINAWPKWLDLEDSLYRPVLLVILPTICRFVCRIFDSLLDTIVVVLRKTIYKDSPLPYELPEGTWLTKAVGTVMNLFQSLANLTWRRSNPGEVDYRHRMAMLYAEVKESNTVIGRSLSFGLMLVCIGFCVTLIYMIWL